MSAEIFHQNIRNKFYVLKDFYGVSSIVKNP